MNEMLRHRLSIYDQSLSTSEIEILYKESLSLNIRERYIIHDNLCKLQNTPEDLLFEIAKFSGYLVFFRDNLSTNFIEKCYKNNINLERIAAYKNTPKYILDSLLDLNDQVINYYISTRNDLSAEFIYKISILKNTPDTYVHLLCRDNCKSFIINKILKNKFAYTITDSSNFFLNKAIKNKNVSLAARNFLFTLFFLREFIP